VQELLDRLQLNPETVLVVRGTELLTRDARLADDDEVEIRPVVSGGSRVCDRRPARGGCGPCGA
jgi:sulfur carrier protein